MCRALERPVLSAVACTDVELTHTASLQLSVCSGLHSPVLALQG